MKEIQSITFVQSCSNNHWKLLKKSLTELTAIVASLPVLRSFLVTDTTQQPHPPSRHITFVPTSYIKKYYQWRMQGRDPAPELLVDKNGMNVVNRNFSLDCPLPPPPVLISRSPSMKSSFLGFLVIPSHWSVLFSSDEALQISILFHQGQFPW